jgi:predicted negative regulator of RcsB-dependent stress response
MSEQYDEHEQSERVKQWVLKNGSNILTFILLIVAAISAWQWWQGKQNKDTQEAANQYQTFIAAIEKPDLGKAIVLGNAFIKNYTKSDFAFLASLRMAKIYLAQGKPKLAMSTLDNAKSVAHNPQQLELLAIRTVQLSLSQANYQQAEKQLNALKPKFFVATYDELQGDLALAKNQTTQAAKHYQSALSKLDASARSRLLIEMKLSEAGGNASKPSEIR